jgi:hypothetical protein
VFRFGGYDVFALAAHQLSAGELFAQLSLRAAGGEEYFLRRRAERICYLCAGSFQRFVGISPMV